MDKDTSILDFGRESTKDALTEVLRSGAQKLLLAAVEEELENFLKGYSSLRLSDGRLSVVRNGHLPARTILWWLTLSRQFFRGIKGVNGNSFRVIYSSTA